MNFKEIASIILAGLLTLATFASCNSSAPPASVSSSAPSEAASSSAPAESAPAESDQVVEIRFPWWGNTVRHEKYDQLMDMFEAQYPNIKVVREPSTFDDYWTKIATQTAGGNPPDVLMFTQGQLSEYVARDAVLALDDYINDATIDLSQFSQTAIDNGKYQGKIYVITKGLSAPALFVNMDLLERVGAPLPPAEMTWDGYKDYLMEIAPLLGSNEQGVKTYPASDHAFNDQVLESWLRLSGKSLFNEAGNGMGFEKEDLIEWFEYWADLRANGLIPAAEVQAEWYKLQWEQGILANHVVAIETRASNHLKVLQSHMQDEVSLWRIPIGEPNQTKNGEILLTASLGISSYSANPDAVAALINFWCNDDEFNQLYMHEHGIVGNQRILESMDMDPSDRKTVDHLNEVLNTITPQPQRPPGQTPIFTQVDKSWQACYFGEISIPEAVDQIFAEVTKVMG